MLLLLQNYSLKLLKNWPSLVTLIIVVVIVWVRVSQKNFPQFSSRFPIGRSVPLSKKILQLQLSLGNCNTARWQRECCGYLFHFFCIIPMNMYCTSLFCHMQTNYFAMKWTTSNCYYFYMFKLNNFSTYLVPGYNWDIPTI